MGGGGEGKPGRKKEEERHGKSSPKGSSSHKKAFFGYVVLPFVCLNDRPSFVQTSTFLRVAGLEPA